MGFAKVIGHEKEIKGLQRLIREEKISHAYLFQGEEGIGKLLVAREFSKSLLCRENKDAYCDRCSSCLKFNTNNHPDFKLILGDGNIIKKSEIDEIVEGVKHAPFESQRKIFIINNANLMNKESMNGLLKTLEEPPAFLNIILVTSKPEELLATIRSRCQLIKFNPILDRDISTYLEENYSLLAKDRSIITSLAKGSLSSAIEMAETGLVLQNRKTIINIIDTLLKGDDTIVFSSEKFFEANKDDIDKILEIMIYWFRDLAIYKETNTTQLLINQDMEDLFIRQSGLSFSKIERIIKNIEETKMNIRGHINYPLSIEMMLLNIWEDNRW